MFRDNSDAARLLIEVDEYRFGPCSATCATDDSVIAAGLEVDLSGVADVVWGDFALAVVWLPREG